MIHPGRSLGFPGVAHGDKCVTHGTLETFSCIGSRINGSPERPMGQTSPQQVKQITLETLRCLARWGELQLLPSIWSLRLWTVFQNIHILSLLIRSEQNADTQICLSVSSYILVRFWVQGDAQPA